MEKIIGFMLRDVYENPKQEYRTTMGDSVEFPIGYVSTKRVIKETDPIRVFELINGYIKYKGRAFEDTLYKTLVEVRDNIYKLPPISTYAELPPILNPILDLLDLNDIISFAINSGIIKVPDVFKETYDLNIEIDDRGSREQTYLKQEYIEFLSLIAIMKACLGPVGLFASEFLNNTSKGQKEYILIHLFLTHPISETRPFIKLMRFIEKHIEISKNSNDDQMFQKRIIELTISEEDYPIYILGKVLFNKLIFVMDNPENNKNMVSVLYEYVKQQIKLKSDYTSSKYRFKTASNNNVAQEHEAESIMETYRTPTDITIGFKKEIEFAYDDPYKLANWLKIKNIDLLNKVLHIFRELEVKSIPEENIYLISWITKNIVDPRGIHYIRIESILKAMAVCFVWLIERGHITLALLLSSYVNTSGEFTLGNIPRKKIEDELVEELDKLYPNKRAVNSKNGVEYKCFIQETIKEFANEYIGKSFISILPKEILMEIKGDTKSLITVNNNIINELARVIIDVDKNT